MSECCPHCETILPQVRDAFCPECRAELDAPVVAVEHVDTKGASDPEPLFENRLTTDEQIFSALVLLWAGFLLVFALGPLHFLVIPKSEDPSSLYFVVSMYWTTVLVLTITTILNLYHQSLRIIPTIVQCAVVSVYILPIPLAIWGGKLLKRRVQQAPKDG